MYTGREPRSARAIGSVNPTTPPSPLNIHSMNNMVKLFHRSIRFRSFFDLIVKKYEINKSQKCTPFWHKMFKIASFSGALGSFLEAHDAPPDPLVVRGFLPSAIAASRLWRLQVPRF